MIRKTLVIIFIIFSFSLVSNYLFAYDEIIVHPFLTQEMAKIYNLNYGDKLTDQEIEWMKKGSKDEDDRQGLLIRSGNHFYNPFGIKKWADNTLVGNIVPEPKLTAKEWAHNSLEQDSFPGGDFTWERAIWDYANGDKQHAYESLGHIMHLIEDSTVPAHTRNDLHISPNDKDLAPYQNLPRFEEIKKALQDGEPYEAWTGGKAWSRNLKFNFSDRLQSENKKPIVLSNIDDYFDDVAKYTNTKFFSKDTIYAYSEPKNNIEGNEKADNGDIVNYIYGFDEYGQKFRLAEISDKNSKNQKILIVDDTTFNIHSDYWSRLAPRAVLTGAGIIKLFKDEANKAVKNPQLIERPKSIASVYGSLAPAVRAADPTIRTLATAGQLLANAAIYGAKSAVAYLGNSAQSKAADFFNSTAKSISGYFSPSAKAQLVFDISSPIKGTTVAEILEASKTIEANLAPEINKVESVYDAKLILDSNNALTFDPGKDIALNLKIKNIGTAIWRGEIVSLNVYIVAKEAEKFYHPSWPTQARPALLAEKVLASGETGHFDFIIKSPLTHGKYDFRVRPVWQNLADGGFSWLGNDIAIWHIEVKAPEIAIAEIPIAGQENIAPENGNAETIPLASPEPSSAPEPNDNPPSEEAGSDINAGGDALAISEAERLQEEEDRAIRRKRARAWAATPPETKIIEFPENPTAETAADFKFSSDKNPSTFYCSLNDSEFVSCEENTAYEKTYENLSSGEHILKVKAKDEYGNYDETPETYEWTIEKEESAPHLVISEIQAGTNENGAEDEFVELYNPTEDAIDLSGWELRKKNSSGKEDNLADNADFTGFIAPKSFFLIAHKNYKGSVAPDLRYSTGNNLSYENNSVILYNGDYQKGAIIDEVIYSEIPKGQSLERKAKQGGICVSSQAKGEFLGNGCDTDDLSDFEIRLAPNPQNSASISEPAPTPAHNITSGLDYPTIQWAINSANPGDEIQVDSGTYYENVIIDKQLILKGVDTGGGKPVVDAGGIGNGISLAAGNITIDGFAVTGSASGAANAGIFVNLGFVSSNNNLIKNNDVSNNSNGIYLQYSSNNTLSGNNILNNEFGFYLAKSNNNTLENNNANNNIYGIVLDYSGNNTLENNIINLNDYAGISLGESDNNKININIVSNSNHGIVLSGRYNQFIGNTVKGRSDGFFIANGYSNTIRENSIIFSHYSLHIFSGGDNKIYHNNFTSIANGAFDVHGMDIWDDDYPSGGNYWSDYTGTDSDNDGIGDTPYVIPCTALFCLAAAQDRYPLMNPYGN